MVLFATVWDPLPSSDCVISEIISWYTLVVSGAGMDNNETKGPTQSRWCSVAAENTDEFEVHIVGSMARAICAARVRRDQQCAGEQRGQNAVQCHEESQACHRTTQCKGISAGPLAPNVPIRHSAGTEVVIEDAQDRTSGVLYAGAVGKERQAGVRDHEV